MKRFTSELHIPLHNDAILLNPGHHAELRNRISETEGGVKLLALLKLGYSIRRVDLSANLEAYETPNAEEAEEYLLLTPRVIDIILTNGTVQQKEFLFFAIYREIFQLSDPNFHLNIIQKITAKINDESVKIESGKKNTLLLKLKEHVELLYLQTEKNLRLTNAVTAMIQSISIQEGTVLSPSLSSQLELLLTQMSLIQYSVSKERRKETIKKLGPALAILTENEISFVKSRRQMVSSIKKNAA